MSSNWKKTVILFLASQNISLFGSSLVQYAITWHITLTTRSGVMMTVSIICGFLPTFFLSPFAGVWADRYSRKNLIMLSDSLIAMAALALAVLFWRGNVSLWLLFLMSAIRALGTAVQTPAIGALLPQLVPEDQLTRVNALNGSIQSVVVLLSPMLSAALLTSSTIGLIFLVDVITAAVAVTIMLLFVRVPAYAKDDTQATSYFRDLRAGFSYIKHHSFVKTLFFFNAILLVLVSPAAFLTPLQVTRSFGGDFWRLTAIEVAFSVGMTAGGLVMAAWGGFRNRLHTMALASMAIGFATVALGIVPVFWVYLLFMSLIGVVLPIMNTPFTVLIQEKVEPEFMGRVFGVLGMISSSMMPLGMLAFGPLADYVRVEWLLIVTGLLMVVQSAFMLGNRVLLQAGARPAHPEA